MRMRAIDRMVVVDAFGAGAAWVCEHAAELTGLADDPSAFQPDDRVMASLRHRVGLVYLPRTRCVFERLVPTILQQLVTWREARRAYLGLVRAHGRPAPGPCDLRLAPDAATMRRLPPVEYVRLGALPRHANTLRDAAAVASRLDALIELAPAEASRRLRTVPGIGPWTAAWVQATVFGDPDAVLVGDYHLPREVCWTLTRRDGDDADMVTLLEPFRGHRWRAIQLIRNAGVRRPRRGPRRPMRPLLRA
jgi:3-methyladenine DNA glycosylase/8-oxoguanine DNA glycosylase